MRSFRWLSIVCIPLSLLHAPCKQATLLSNWQSITRKATLLRLWRSTKRQIRPLPYQVVDVKARERERKWVYWGGWWCIKCVCACVYDVYRMIIVYGSEFSKDSSKKIVFRRVVGVGEAKDGARRRVRSQNGGHCDVRVLYTPQGSVGFGFDFWENLIFIQWSNGSELWLLQPSALLSLSHTHTLSLSDKPLSLLFSHFFLHRFLLLPSLSISLLLSSSLMWRF